MSFVPWPKSHGKWGNDLSENIRLLVAHGADIAVRDKKGMSCLHALLSNKWFHYDLDRIAMIDALCLFLQLGADMHAVTLSGYSVTELANLLRNGQIWQEALEKAGYDVEGVFLEDSNYGSVISDDIYAPREGHSRRRGSYSDEYFDLDMRELGRRFYGVDHMESMFEDELDESDDEPNGEEEEGQDSIMDLKEHKQAPIHGFIDESPLDSDSDEDMGGVPVTN